MQIGGNQRLFDFFRNYDLIDENVAERYGTKAAEHYRINLRSESDGLPFQVGPTYDRGREQADSFHQTSYEERFA